jgi:hypothetical protein
MPKSLIHQSLRLPIPQPSLVADDKEPIKMSDQKENLFPSMGDVASRTNALADVKDDDKRLAHDAPTLEEQDDGEEREVQEIESLCMRCHEQVS